jgi:hypothetical protein
LLKDLNRENVRLKIDDLISWREAIEIAIDDGYAVDRMGNEVVLDEVQGEMKDQS